MIEDENLKLSLKMYRLVRLGESSMRLLNTTKYFLTRLSAVDILHMIFVLSLLDTSIRRF